MTMKCISFLTCFIIWLSLVLSRDCPQCFHSQRIALMTDNMQTQTSNTRRQIFRLKSNNNNNGTINPIILPLNRDVRTEIKWKPNARAHFRNGDHLLDADGQPFVANAEEVITESANHVITTPANRYRVRPVSVRTGRRTRKRLRKVSTPTSIPTTTTTTTTTTTAPPPEYDYYEYEDDYDYDDYHLTTTTTTTTTAAPARRRSGRRRFRRTSTTTPSTTTTTLSPNYKHRPDGRIIDYLADPNFPYELKGADLTQYPFYISIPENDFNCRGRHDGYYANIELKCQVYHHCAAGHQRYDFLCPNYTLFDQTTFTCRFINTVDCDASENHYVRNNELYVETTIAPNNKTK